MSPLRVMVVDDDDSVRMLLRTALPLLDVPVEVVGWAVDGSEAVERAAELKPDLIILDHCMPKTTGAEVLGDLREKCPNADILMFSAYLDSPVFENQINSQSQRHGVPTIPKGQFTELETAVTLVAIRRQKASL